MSPTIDNNFLASLGLGSIPEEEKKRMLLDIAENLMAKVGLRVEAQLNEDQLQAYDQLLENSDASAIQQWLQTNVPDYQRIVSEEIDKLREEIKPQVPGILQQIVGAS